MGNDNQKPMTYTAGTVISYALKSAGFMEIGAMMKGGEMDLAVKELIKPSEIPSSLFLPFGLVNEEMWGIQSELGVKAAFTKGNRCVSDAADAERVVIVSYDVDLHDPINACPMIELDTSVSSYVKRDRADAKKLERIIGRFEDNHKRFKSLMPENAVYVSPPSGPSRVIASVRTMARRLLGFGDK